MKLTEKKLKETLKKIAKILEKRPEVLAAYLYGSYAKGYARDGSDLDIAILTRPQFVPKSYGYQVDIDTLLNKAVPDNKVEAVVVDFMPLALKHSAVVQGKVIYSRNDLLRAGEQIKIINNYEDMIDFYQMRLDSNIKAAKQYLLEREIL